MTRHAVKKFFPRHGLAAGVRLRWTCSAEAFAGDIRVLVTPLDHRWATHTVYTVSRSRRR